MNSNMIGTTLLLLAGSLAAMPAAADGDPESKRSRAAAEARAERAERMARELGLTDEQQQQVESIMADSRQRAAEIQRELREERRNARQEMMAVRDDTRKRVNEVLTEEQRARLQELRAEARQNHEREGRQRGQQPD